MKKILTIALLAITFGSCNRIKPEERVLNKTDKDSILVVSIPKAGCQNCQKVVENGLLTETGVKQSILNLHTKEVSILYNPEVTSNQTLKKRVNELTHKIPCK